MEPLLVTTKAFASKGYPMKSLGWKEQRLKEAVDEIENNQVGATNPQYYAFLLKECAHVKSILDGKRVHAHMRAMGLMDLHKPLLGNLLLHMYGNCGSLRDACSVFDELHERNVSSWNIMLSAYARNQHLDMAKLVFHTMPQQDVVSWNSMISAYVQNGHSTQAVELFQDMGIKGMQPNRVTFITLLDACVALKDLNQGKKIHSSLIHSGLHLDLTLNNALINMYGKCGSLVDARCVFDQLLHRNIVSWNTMISIYAHNGHSKEALHLFCCMGFEGMKPNKITLVSALSACARMVALSDGRKIHASVVDHGFEADVVVGTALINMYGKCGSLHDARECFDKMPQRNVFSWTAMITAYAQNGNGKEALKLFRKMNEDGIQPNKITFISVLDACASARNLAQGKTIHSTICDCGFESDVVVATALLNMYGRCGSLEDAKNMFDKMPQRNVASWNAMIAACAENGNVDDARVMFDNMSCRNVVSWNVMITAYTRNGHAKDAVELFQQMSLAGITPDKITFISVLDACAILADLTEGEQIHASIVHAELESDVVVGTALVKMYGRCGILDAAKRAFEKISQQNQVSWNTMIAAYAQNGYVEEAFKLLEQMKMEGLKPDNITLTSILSACSHGGLLEDGWQHLISITRDHNVAPTEKHYGCMVDLCGRAGHLDEAEDLISNIPFQLDAVTWKTLLGACRMYGDAERGAHIATHVFKLDPGDCAPYMLLSNIYAAADRKGDVAKVRQAVQSRGMEIV